MKAKNSEQYKNTKRCRRYGQGENNQTAKEEKRVASELNLLLTVRFLTYTRVDGHQCWLTTSTHLIGRVLPCSLRTEETRAPKLSCCEFQLC